MKFYEVLSIFSFSVIGMVLVGEALSSVVDIGVDPLPGVHVAPGGDALVLAAGGVGSFAYALSELANRK